MNLTSLDHMYSGAKALYPPSFYILTTHELVDGHVTPESIVMFIFMSPSNCDWVGAAPAWSLRLAVASSRLLSSPPGLHDRGTGHGSLQVSWLNFV